MVAATRKLGDLIKNGYNPRKLSENERRDLEKSVQEFGTVVPIVLNIGSRANTIIGGEQRVKVYADLGIEEVECMVPSRELALDEERELNLRLNKNTGSWNEELLKDFDMSVLLMWASATRNFRTYSTMSTWSMTTLMSRRRSRKRSRRK